MIRIKQDSKEIFCPLFYLSYIGIYRIVVNSWIFDSIKMDPGKWYIFTVNKIKFETLRPPLWRNGAPPKIIQLQDLKLGGH